mmetsp:Transcript_128421/g.371669  ORF Transcript_128421/g.371669 Transcript_128421/m.371669 type:complete len:187 (-) Transcript_128421:118-678(-)
MAQDALDLEIEALERMLADEGDPDADGGVAAERPVERGRACGGTEPVQPTTLTASPLPTPGLGAPGRSARESPPGRPLNRGAAEDDDDIDWDDACRGILGASTPAAPPKGDLQEVDDLLHALELDPEVQNTDLALVGNGSRQQDRGGDRDGRGRGVGALTAKPLCGMAAASVEWDTEVEEILSTME